MSRKSDAYLINDNELDSLEDIATHIAASGSLVAFCLTMVLAALWDLGYSFEAAKIPFAVGWMAVWGIAGFCVWKYTEQQKTRRESLVARIRRESICSSQPEANA
jgi:hypothetical protein